MLLAPLTLLVGIIVAVLIFPGQQDAIRIDGSDVTFLADSVTALPPEDAQRAINLARDHDRDAAHLTPTTPFWMSVKLPSHRNNTGATLEIRLMRAESAQFWLVGAPSQSAPSAVNRATPPRPLTWKANKGGLAVTIPPPAGQGGVEVIAHVVPTNFVRPKVFLWENEAFARSELGFERLGGILFGSMIMLAGFSAVIALINREKTFLLFGAWLITSLRVAAINHGWDLYWLGTTLSAETGALIGRLTLATHGLLTIALFSALFQSELARQRGSRVVNVLMLTWAALIAAGVFVPSDMLLPAIWANAVFSVLTLAAFLARIQIAAPSSVGWWYTASWGFFFAGIIGDVAFATGLSRIPIIGINSQAGAVFSALTMAIALADRMRAERNARIQAQSRALFALRQFRDTYNSVPVGLCTLDAAGRFVDLNPTMSTLLGVDMATRRSAEYSWDAFFGNGSFESLRAGLSERDHTDAELAAGSNAHRRWFRVRAVQKGERVECSVEDITQRREADLKLRFLAHHDPLTSLLNRRGFDVRFEQASRAVADGHPVLLAYLDLDRFKLVNDLFGHTAGDHVLRQVAERLKGHVKAPHSVARVGGDEFLVLFHGIPVPDARKICDSMLRDIRSTPFTFQDKAFSVDGSIGLTPLERNMSERDAVATCDRACAEAKRLGGGTVVVLNENSAEVRQHLDEIRLIAGIRDSVPEGRLFTVMQPIVSLRDAAGSLSYEVLLRMRDDDGKVIPPGRFIGAAERNGLMTRIDRWVLADTLRWLDAHPDHRERLDFASLNISGASLNDERFIEDVLAIVRDHPDSARRLCFEVTESVALYDINSTRRFVDMIKSFGARVALDDFGAGYTSFSYLKELRGDFVKVDGGFIRDVNSNPANFAITRAIVDVSHELGMACIAEWAENAEIVRSLLRLDVDFAQGYGLSRPLDSDILLRAPDCGVLMHDPEIRGLLDLGSPLETAATEPRQLVHVG